MTQPNPRDIRRTCLDLIAATPVFYLTTLGADGYPHTTAMCNLRCAAEYPTLAEFQAEHGDDLTLFTSTCMGSDKIGRIRANPKVSAYFCDPQQIVGFMLGGRIEIMEDRRLKARLWQKDWTLFYPGGPEGPECGILRLVPRVARGWLRTEPFVLTLSQKGDNPV